MPHHLCLVHGLLMGLCVFFANAHCRADNQPTIRLIPDDTGKPAFEATGIPSARLAGLADSQSATHPAVRFLTIHVVEQNANPDQPAMLGHYCVKDNSLIFMPRFVLRPGVRYRAVFSPAGTINENAPTQTEPAHGAIVREFTIPDASEAKPATVQKIYPSANVLPENLLRFYIHFSAPMSRGDAYRHVALIKEDGAAVDLPFLELGEELWDRAGQRLTLLVDPGRIKRGVKPREDLGPVLEEGQSYTLVVDRKWKDATGRPLAEGFHKTFAAGPAVQLAIDPKTWKVSEPRVGTSDPLLVQFSRPLDHALLESRMAIEAADGIAIPGKVIVADNECRWSFQPERPWPAGEYRIVVDTVLEDLVGNRIGRAFEVDRTETIERQVLPEEVRIPFQIKEDSRVR